MFNLLKSILQGNRQLLNGNTEALFRNKVQLIKNAFVGVTDPLKLSYRDALLNKAKLEFLDSRTKQNIRVNSVSEELAQINSRLIEINSEIMGNLRSTCHFASYQR